MEQDWRETDPRRQIAVAVQRFNRSRDEKGKGAWSRPISRVLSRTIIHLGRESLRGSSDLPESGAGRTDGFLFGLAPGGVCHATRVATRAVRSYRTISPLPHRRCVASGRYLFCCTFRGLAPPRRYLAPCPVEPGLSSPPATRQSDCLANSMPHQLNQLGTPATSLSAQTRSLFFHSGIKNADRLEADPMKTPVGVHRGFLFCVTLRQQTA